VDELLEFIGEDSRTRSITPPLPSTVTAKKKSNKKAKKKKKSSKMDVDEEIDKKDDGKQDDAGKSTSNSSSSKDDEDDDDLEDLVIKFELLEDGFEEPQDPEEEGDDLDPEMRAALDKEVEEFRQRLESINSQTRTSPKIPLPIPAASFVSSLVGVH